MPITAHLPSPLRAEYDCFPKQIDLRGPTPAAHLMGITKRLFPVSKGALDKEFAMLAIYEQRDPAHGATHALEVFQTFCALMSLHDHYVANTTGQPLSPYARIAAYHFGFIFAVAHDAAREASGPDKGHGERAAFKVVPRICSLLRLPEWYEHEAAIVCRLHEQPGHEINLPPSGVELSAHGSAHLSSWMRVWCIEADRLLLARVGITLDSAYFHSPSAKALASGSVSTTYAIAKGTVDFMETFK